MHGLWPLNKEFIYKLCFRILQERAISLVVTSCFMKKPKGKPECIIISDT